MINASVQTVSAERYSDWRIRASTPKCRQNPACPAVTVTDSHAVQADTNVLMMTMMIDAAGC